MEEKEITYELKIQIKKEQFEYGFVDEFCAYLTGAVGEREDDDHGYKFSNGLTEARHFREEENNYDFPVRLEYQGYYHEPNYWHNDNLYIYLKHPLNEIEIDLIKRRTERFATERNFDILSIQEVEKMIITNEREHQRIL